MNHLINISIGIDTVYLYCALTYKQARAIIDTIAKLSAFFTEFDDYEFDRYACRSEHFADRGIKIRAAKYGGGPWGLYILLHPALLLGSDDRSALYQPTKGNYHELLKRARKLFAKLNIPFKLEDMALIRVDVTMNLVFDDPEYVSSYLRIIKKGFILAHYKLDWFREDEHKARDPKEANRHSYKQRCKSACYFAYDKSAQLQMIDKFPEALVGKHILRLEAQLTSRAIKKWIDRDARGDQYKTLRQLVKNGSKFHRWYLKRMGLLAGEHLRYEEAVELVSGVKGKKTRKRMLQIMDALGYNKANLSNVLDKLELKPNAASKALREFSKLGISPITVPNAEDASLPGLAELLELPLEK